MDPLLERIKQEMLSNAINLYRSRKYKEIDQYDHFLMNFLNSISEGTLYINSSGTPYNYLIKYLNKQFQFLNNL